MKKLVIGLFLIFANSVIIFGQTAQDEAIFFFAKGEHLRKQRLYNEAIDQYAKSMNLDAGNHRTPFSKALCHVQLKDYEAAIEALQQSTKIKEDYIQAYEMMIFCYKNLKKKDGIIEAYSKAFMFEENLEKKIAYKRELIGVLVENEDYVNAKMHIDSYKKISPEQHLDILYFEAKVSNQLGDYQTAKKNMLAAKEMLKTPALKEIAKYYYELGYAHHKLKEFEEASQAWEKADYGNYKKQIAQFDPKYYFNVAECYSSIYEYTLAQQYVDETLYIRNNYAPAKILLARISIKTARQDDAIRFFREAVQLEQDQKKNAGIQAELAELLINTGRYQDAIQAADKCLESQPRNYDMVLIKAMSYYRLKNYGTANQVLEQILSQKDLGKNVLSKFYFAAAVIYRASLFNEQAKQAFKNSAVGLYSNAAKIEFQKLSDEELE